VRIESSRTVFFSLALVLGGARISGGDVVRHPTGVGASFDVGQIVKGRLVGAASDDTSSGDGQFLQRNGVYLSESVTIDGKLTVQLTLGGLFFYALPERVDKPEYRFVQFGNGVGQAQAAYSFGPVDDPSSVLRAGLFPIKYNSDSKNLGEYLYRSGTYPALIYTGGWSYLNSSNYMGQGVQFTWNAFEGALVHDFTLTMERDLQPNLDFSPGYSLRWKPSPFFEAGAGVVWANGLSLRPSLLMPKVSQNAYVRSSGKPLGYGPAGKADMEAPGYALNDPAVLTDPSDPRLGQDVDPVGRPGVKYVVRGVFDAADPALIGKPVPGKPGFVFAAVGDPSNGEEPLVNGTPRSDVDHYTFRGFKTMARASMNLGAMFGMEAAMGQDAFKLYGELALLGVKNQPFYYEKKSERMPVMAGVNIPTFKLLDMLSFEMEYLKSRFRNNHNVVFNKKWPLPMPNTEENPAVYDNLPELTKDDWKWSLYARKTLTEGMNLTFQAASDHQRPIGFEYGPFLADFPATEFSSDWYYVLRVEVGI
jgi:hypothetical protein